MDNPEFELHPYQSWLLYNIQYTILRFIRGDLQSCTLEVGSWADAPMQPRGVVSVGGWVAKTCKRLFSYPLNTTKSL